MCDSDCLWQAEREQAQTLTEALRREQDGRRDLADRVQRETLQRQQSEQELSTERQVRAEIESQKVCPLGVYLFV